jgi:hypothetical protein
VSWGPESEPEIGFGCRHPLPDTCLGDLSVEFPVGFGGRRREGLLVTEESRMVSLATLKGVNPIEIYCKYTCKCHDVSAMCNYYMLIKYFLKKNVFP